MKNSSLLRMRRTLHPVLGPLMVLLVLLLPGCPEWPFEPDKSVVYFNSFETPADTSGWTGLSPTMFVEDPAPGQGLRSLRIGGGCVQPTAYWNLDPVFGEGDYQLSFWGRVNDANQSGTVILRRTDVSDREIGITLHENRWVYYRNPNTLHVPAGSRMRIEIVIGGYVPASMNIDGLAVLKVE